MAEITVRDADQRDRDGILAFCRGTFSWGDYIEEVWDHWLLEGGMLCACEGGGPPVGACHASFHVPARQAFTVPLGNSTDSTCHASFHVPARQVWIEGIRVHPGHRRRRIASSLVLRSESMGALRGCTGSFMLVEDSNSASLRMAEGLGYVAESTWVFYSVGGAPPARPSNARAVRSPRSGPVGDLLGRSLRFVDSWRWIPLDGGSAAGLVAGGRLIHTRNGGVDSLATVVPSRHFEDTVLVTVLRADQRGMDQIIRYAQGLGAGEGAPRIQLLARSDPALDCGPARKRLVFRLVGKRIPRGGAPAGGGGVSPRP